MFDEFSIQIQNEFDESHAKTLIGLWKKYEKKASNIHWGRTRVAFIINNIVVKLPLYSDGCIDNDHEGSFFCDEYANTKLTYCNDIPILFMEYVKHANFDAIKDEFGNIPDWVYSIDCGQVGFNRKGKLVAYDYGVC